MKNITASSGLRLAPGIALSPEDRTRHVIVAAGSNGVGFTQYISSLLIQELRHGFQVILIDRSGDITKQLKQDIPQDAQQNFAYLNIGDEQTDGLNVFDVKSEEEKREICNAVISLMFDLYDPNRTGVIGPRFEHAMRNAMLTIMFDEHPTFLTLIRCLTDATYVQTILPKVTDETVRDYWTKQVAQTSDFHKSEVLDYIVSKLGPFVADQKIRRILAQPVPTLDLHQLVMEKKSMLIDLSAFLGDADAGKLIGAVVMLKLSQALRSRFPKHDESVCLYVDDVVSLPAGPIVEFLRTGRKYQTDLTLGVGHLSDLSNPLRNELLSAGTIVAFRMDLEGAKLLAPALHSSVGIDDLCMLKKFHVFMKYLKDGNPVSIGKAVNLNERTKGKRSTSSRQH